MITTREKFLIVYSVFSAVDSTPRSTISHRIFGRVTKLQDVIDGADMVTGTYDKALKYFSDNWPEGADWPSNVERPAPTKLEAAQ